VVEESRWGVCKPAGQQLGECNCKTTLGRCGPPLPWLQHPQHGRLRTKVKVHGGQLANHCVVLQAVWPNGRPKKSAQPAVAQLRLRIR
jgi:hypothetical protein